ncbi:cytochrome c biogenesis protein ResB [Knoellia koreensis]|uniref:Cytochrome c biogenesis protein ResB n=1 Tax=Knoellia koreensis TaxID=2730921 RepID=A0A849HMG0_9MICO|nr:cytochrome c biogenesis protein ResB [Knoellia sp. DB2414S]NNM47853.1 cytochrome c biogenesis protein ResB [Knoellia sp. DB2414S]
MTELKQRQVGTITQPRLGPTGWARWAWRQLTSMRAALLLLLCLAVAAVPGSIWPQRNIDAARVADYLQRHPLAGPWMDRIGLFDVYASPWFAAIYILLLVSLIGCIGPRTMHYARAYRAAPPRPPRHLDRLEAHRRVQVPGTPQEVVHRTRTILGRRHYRTHAYDEHSISAESGHLGEAGNLLFHASLALIVIAVAAGHLFGWRGDAIVPEGQALTNTLSSYGTFSPGPWVDTERLAPFTVRVDSMRATFEEQASGAQFGAPRVFTATVTASDGPGDPTRRTKLEVNKPLSLPGAKAFLLGNGYAPVVTVRDGAGKVVYRDATPFLPQDNNYRSTGAIKVSGLPKDRQLGFTGLFLPTATIEARIGPTSLFPALKNPALVLTAYEGELYPGGRPQNVYTLATDAMTQLRQPSGDPVRIWLTPGSTVQLPGGRGSITLESVSRFAGLSVRHDPAKPFALIGAIGAMLGLTFSFTTRRRRVFVRVMPVVGGAETTPMTIVDFGALAKGGDPRLRAAVDRLISDLFGTERERS